MRMEEAQDVYYESELYLDLDYVDHKIRLNKPNAYRVSTMFLIS